ncbi:MAG TPA: hypothetical protein VHQ90_20445 [Thermoanaerobaculia bacterium]|nr:hypothetical protein [Thermoanaerobaculia bacterium]
MIYCKRGPLAAAACLVVAAATAAGAKPYPMSAGSLCGAAQTCAQVIDRWNTASWNALVDDQINTLMPKLAAVRWYTTEGTCTGTLCNDQLNNGGGSCPALNTANSQFCGVTDELSNVLLSYSMGSDQGRYEELRNFTELLRHPAANGLQCWKFYVNGRKAYASYADVCVSSDSAADASLRILGAYGIACAKQYGKVWSLAQGGPNYCDDYTRQGNAILGLGTPSHGEVKILANGHYFLANGYNNQAGAPTAAQSFRPDYYELQFLMDFADYSQSCVLTQGVTDLLTEYGVAMGSGHVHRGKTGHFDSNATNYTCDDLCSPPYMDNIDTWRAVPALSGLLNVHPDRVPLGLRSNIFDYWWQSYGGGAGGLYGATQPKPFEVYSDGGIKYSEDSYKTLGMWIPLGAVYDAAYTAAAVRHLVDDKYDTAHERFWGAAYFGGYYSQFAQRAIGAATGLIDRHTWENGPPH